MNKLDKAVTGIIVVAIPVVAPVVICALGVVVVIHLSYKFIKC